MKKVMIGMFCMFALVLSACSQQETAKTEAPSPTPVAVVATPTPAPVAAGDLAKAKTDLEKALTEYKAKNYTGAVASVDAAHKELVAAAANAPVALKTGLESAGKGLEAAKGLVEKHDAGAEKTLSGLVATVSKLAETAKASSAAAGVGAMVKGAAEKMMPAAKPAEKK